MCSEGCLQALFCTVRCRPSTANMSDAPKTVFFTSCRGVFSGGGCRAAAHVGAVEGALQAGVNFSEVAGTSAGSIIAALLGAGASSEFLRRHCGSLVFSELLAAPTGTSLDMGALGRFLRWLPFVGRSLIGRIVAYGGAYSSSAIETWVDERITELLPEAPRPVKFKALLLPTTIVATDLFGGQPKIWSTTTTPDESVALAVRCSCSIPLFFEPVVVGNSRLVDGGLLSNLPAFVFADSQSSNGLSGRILAFSLEDELQLRARWTPRELLRSLIDTIVGGAKRVQNSIQPNVNVISIPTDGVRATDFNVTPELLATLIENGRDAVFRFIQSEALHLRSDRGSADQYADGDSFLAELTREAFTTGAGFIATAPDTYWFWQIFPTILAWREAGAFLQVLVEPVNGSQELVAREMQRRNLLTQLGATVIERPQTPFHGFLLKRSDDYRDAAFITNPSRTLHASHGTAYMGIHHRPVLKVITRELSNEFNTSPNPIEHCSLGSHSAHDIIELLKAGVWQYRKPGVSIALEQVSIDHVQMIVRRIRSFKFTQIGHLFELYRKYNLECFVPAAVLSGGSLVSVITPPVFEEWGGNMVAIEGNTRVYYLYKKGFLKIFGLVVRGVSEQLPGRPVWPRQALLCTAPLEPPERINGFNYEQFRSIEGSARPITA